MSLRPFALLCLATVMFCTSPAAAEDPAVGTPPVTKSSWNGFEQLNFQVDGRSCLVVVPAARAAGSPWIWRTEFFGHEPQADLALLSNGWHVVYMDVQNLYGAPAALDHMDRFYEHLTGTLRLSAKAVLEGFSRGGLFAFNWAARHPGRVSSLYVDAPVCDFKSWPGGLGKGKGSPDDWALCKKVYGLDDAAARAWKLNPVDNLAPLAGARIPILSVCGDADDVVPMPENTGLVEERYAKLGGEIKVISKPGVGHHPHSLKDPKPIVDFILAHAGGRDGLFPENVKRVLFLGDSITYSGQYVAFISAYHHARFPGRVIEFLNLGLPSETASGLSEVGHLQHGFPRPDLHERLGRVLDRTRPDLVLACYGMNDGIYLPLTADRFQAYQESIRWLREEVIRAGARLVLVTPPIYDDVRGGQKGYGAVLDRYAEWLLEQRVRGWDVVDLHTPMKTHLEQHRATDPAYNMAGDGVHPDATGHWLMARSILLHLGARDVVGVESAAQLFSSIPGGTALLEKDQQQLALWRDAWLTATGHKRPGLPVGRAIEIDPKTGAATMLPAAAPAPPGK